MGGLINTKEGLMACDSSQDVEFWLNATSFKTWMEVNLLEQHPKHQTAKTLRCLLYRVLCYLVPKTKANS